MSYNINIVTSDYKPLNTDHLSLSKYSPKKCITMIVKKIL
jgi:hypothetical protein